MESLHTPQYTREITDPAMEPLKRWIESYTSWEKLQQNERDDILARVKRGDKDAIDAMTNHNLRWVLSRATKRVGRGVPLTDLVQEGWIGLRTAVQKFDPGRGNQFSTMATWWIDRALRNAIITQGRAIYLPHNAVERLARITRSVLEGRPMRLHDQAWLNRLAHQLGGNPYLANATVGYIEHLLRGPRSLEEPVHKDVLFTGVDRTTTLGDTIPAPAQPDPTDSIDVGNVLVEMVNRKKMRPRDAWMLIRSYGLDGSGEHSMEEIGAELFAAEQRAGVNTKRTAPYTREAVRQHIARARRELRLYLEETQPGYFVSQPAHGTLKEQRKGSQVPLSPGKVKSTESPKTRSTRHTSVNDLSQETAASRAAAPTPLRAKSSTKRAKRSSQHSQVSGVDVPYPEAI